MSSEAGVEASEIVDSEETEERGEITEGVEASICGF